MTKQSNELKPSVGNVGNSNSVDVETPSTPPPKPVNIKVNAVYNLISKLLLIFIPLITAPYLARILGEEGNGQISYVSSIITYFTLISSLGFSVYGQREIAKCKGDKNSKSIIFWEIFFIKLICTLFALCVLFILLFTIGFGERYNTLIFIMSIQVVAVIFDIEYLYMGEENFKSIAIRNIIVKIIGVILIFVFVNDAEDVWVYALYLSGSTFFSYAVMWTGLSKHIKFVSLKEIKPFRHIKGAIIIFIPMVITSLFTTFDKTMIGLLAPNPDYENGCYEQAYKINSVAQTIVTVFSSVMMSRNSADYKNGDIESMKKHIYKNANYIWMTSLFFIAGFLVLSKNFSSWFFGKGYDEVPALLQIMSVRLVASGFSILLGDRFIAMGEEKWWFISVSVGALSNILINYLMIPTYGAIGAATATAICEVMILMTNIVFTLIKKDLSLKRVFCSCWKYFIAAVAMFAVMFVLQYYLVNAVWSFILIGVVGAFIFAISLLILRDAFFMEICRLVIKKIKAVLKR